MNESQDHDGRDAAAAKQALRTALSARARALLPAERKSGSLAACDALIRLLERELPPGVPIALYAATATELDAAPAAARLEARHPLAFPRVSSASERLSFHLARPDELIPGVAGIRSPPADAPEVTPQAIVLPGRAFDRSGIRLGRGAGHYDRTLAGLPPGLLLVGMAYAFQIVDRLPRESHDRPVDWLVTPLGETPVRRTPIPTDTSPAASSEKSRPALVQRGQKLR